MSSILDEIWDRVVGGLDWLKQVVFGEFQDNRDMSAVVADMLVSFVPGVVIITSARDLTAVILRLAQHEERREKTEEWMLLIACAVPLVLPVLAAAAGAAAAGVGAIIGGIAGSEAGAALRAVCLLLIKKGQALVEVVGFLRRFVKGDIMKVLHEVKFQQYGHALVRYTGEFIGKLIGILQRVRAELLKVNTFKMLDDVLAKLADLERRFYGVQQSAMAAIPKALAELDVRLQKVLAESLPHNPRPALAGIPAPPPRPVTPEPQRVASMSSNPLGTPANTAPPNRPPPRTPPEPNLHPEHPREPKVRAMPEKSVPCFSSANLPASKAGEMERQLAGQQAGLNEMSVRDYLEGRKKFQEFGRGSGKPAVDARQVHQKKLADEFRDRHIAAGMDPLEAKQRGATEAASQMATLAALHNPDMVAGGTNVITDMGDRGVNSSIGSQWKGRVSEVDAAATKVPENLRSTTKMNVKLERCK